MKPRSHAPSSQPRAGRRQGWGDGDSGARYVGVEAEEEEEASGSRRRCRLKRVRSVERESIESLEKGAPRGETGEMGFDEEGRRRREEA